MKYKLDCHMHTFACGHAYSTVKEYIDRAKEIGLDLIAITEHTPEMPGSTHIFFFHNMKIIPDYVDGVRVLKGAEVNIMDREGHIDIQNEALAGLDIAIASIHPPCFGEGDESQDYTDVYLEVMKNPYITIIGHPDDGRFPVDYERLVEGAKKYGKLLELNNSSIKPTSFRMNSRENYMKLLKVCKEKQVPIIIGSDSHFYSTLGDFEMAEELLREVDFPDELIINTSIDKLLPYLNK